MFQAAEEKQSEERWMKEEEERLAREELERFEKRTGENKVTAWMFKNLVQKPKTLFKNYVRNSFMY